MKQSLIVSIVVDGENAMGEPLVEMFGVLTEGKKTKHFQHYGSVRSAREIVEALEEVFEVKG